MVDLQNVKQRKWWKGEYRARGDRKPDECLAHKMQCLWTGWGQSILKKCPEEMSVFIRSLSRLQSKERLATQLREFVGRLEEPEIPVSRCHCSRQV